MAIREKGGPRPKEPQWAAVSFLLEVCTQGRAALPASGGSVWNGKHDVHLQGAEGTDSPSFLANDLGLLRPGSHGA